MSKEEVKESKSKFSIVRKISAFLKLGDDGKLDSFFTRIEKVLTKEIEGHKKNIEFDTFNSGKIIDDLKDNLEDAKQLEAETYLDVTPDQVTTNQMQKDLIDTYLQRIKSQEGAVKRIEDSIKEEKTKLQDKIDEHNLNIKTCKKRIDSILK